MATPEQIDLLLSKAEWKWANLVNDSLIKFQGGAKMCFDSELEYMWELISALTYQLEILDYTSTKTQNIYACLFLLVQQDDPNPNTDPNFQYDNQVLIIITDNVDPADFVKKTGDPQTISSLITFALSPVVPDATDSDQAVAYGQLPSFNNGITKTIGVAQLGGPLVQDTAIDLAGYALSIRDNGNSGMELGTGYGFMTAVSGAGVSSLYLYGNLASIEYNNMIGAYRSLQVDNGGMRVTDTISSTGLKNSGDYEANFTGRSLITKQYGDANYAAIAPGSGYVPYDNPTSDINIRDKQIRTQYALAGVNYAASMQYGTFYAQTTYLGVVKRAEIQSDSFRLANQNTVDYFQVTLGNIGSDAVFESNVNIKFSAASVQVDSAPVNANDVLRKTDFNTLGDARYPQLGSSYADPSWISSLAWSKVTATPTTVAGYGITDALSTSRTITINGITKDLSANRSWTVGDALVVNPLNQFAPTTSAQLRSVLSDETGSGLAYFQGGDIGTPSAGVATNLSGTAASLTAGLVTSIGNLTGDITSVNRTTTLATINSNVGSFNTVTVNAKGLVTSALNLAYKISNNQIDFYGKQVIVIGDSYTSGSGATNTARRYSTIFTEGMGAIEVNYGIAGSTVSKRSPIDYQGAVNLLDRLSNIPIKTSSMALLVFEFGLNDMGQNGANYTASNYIIDYTTALNNAISKGWLPSQILMIAPAYIGTTGYNLYATISGNPAPTQAHHLQFVDATKTVADNFGTLYIDWFHDQIKNDTTLLAADGIHPNDKGHAFLGNDLIRFFGGNLSAGDKVPLATATPLSANMGATYGNNTPGSAGNLKYRFYDDGVNKAGIGESSNMQEYQIYSGGFHTFFNGGVKSAEIGPSLSYFGNGTKGFYIGAYTGALVNGALYSQTVTPSDINYALSASANATAVNATSKVSFGINNVDVGYFDASGNFFINNTPATSAGTFKLLARNSSSGVTEVTTALPNGTNILGTFNLKNYTVATLPAGTRGDIAYVTDALAPSFLVAVVGGGSVVTPVFYNGTTWVAQ